MFRVRILDINWFVVGDTTEEGTSGEGVGESMYGDVRGAIHGTCLWVK